VTARLIQWRGAVARAVLLAVTAALIPVPALSADSTKPAPTVKTIRASMQDMVAREVAKSPAVRPAKRAQQDNPSTQSGNFFKSGPGIAALVVMAAGTGYAVYSASHDRIHSPAKK
jgi:hypothetical protein